MSNVNPIESQIGVPVEPAADPDRALDCSGDKAVRHVATHSQSDRAIIESTYLREPTGERAFRVDWSGRVGAAHGHLATVELFTA